MAFQRRSGQRFTANVWPGFVDAMTALLLVLMFVLSIFMIVQFVLSETISDQGLELDELGSQVASLADALGLEQQRSTALEGEVAELGSERDRQAARIATLTADREQLVGRVASFEERVARLLATRERLQASLSATETERDALTEDLAETEAAREALAGELRTSQAELERIIDAEEAAQLALASAREEIDAQAEEARREAAEREALEALTADLRAEAEARDATLAETLAGLDAARETGTTLEEQVATLEGELDAEEAARLSEAAAAEALRERLAETETQLSDEEAARLAEAAAAEALRARLEDADAELTAMTLALEEERQAAEETLTLLAATRTARDDLDDRLAQALADVTLAQGETATVEERLATVESDRAAMADRLSESEARITAIEDRLAAALAAVETGQGEATALEAEVTRLNVALAAQGAEAADAEERRAELERRLAAALAAQEAGDVTEAELRDTLAAALAARVAAESEIEEVMTERQRLDTLLSEAEARLSDVDEDRIAAQREAEALNRQLAELRTQLGGIRNLLDEYEGRDTEGAVQVESLGQRLNAALAQAASDQRARADLEEAERARLQAEAEALVAEAEQLKRFRSEFFGQLREVLSGREGVEVVGDRFVFSSEVLFAPGSANLQPEGRSQIAQVADVILDVAGEIPEGIGWVLRVDGHTDNIPLTGRGAYADNWELSQARALSVVRYMIDALGVPPTRLAATGFGEWQPVDTSGTPEARARNRRIELKLTER